MVQQGLDDFGAAQEGGSDKWRCAIIVPGVHIRPILNQCQGRLNLAKHCRCAQWAGSSWPPSEKVVHVEGEDLLQPNLLASYSAEGCLS